MSVSKAETFQRLTGTDGIRADLRTKSVRAAAFTWTAGMGDFILRIGSTAILARLILPEHFGLVMMIMAVTSIADQFRDLGLSTVTVQRHTITHEEISNLFWINVCAGVAIAAVVCAASPLIAAYYKEPRLIVPTCILAVNFIWGGLLVQHQALLTRQLKLGYTSTVRLLSSVFSTGLAVALAWKGFGYWALVWREFTRSALLAIGMWTAFPWMPGLPSRKTNVRGLLRFGTDLSVANIIGSVSNGADRFLLGRFWGAEPMAMYRQAYQLLVMPMEQLLAPVYQVTQPGLSMLQTEAARFRAFYSKVLSVACLATMPLSVFVGVYSYEITRVLLGRRWAASAPLLMILSVSTFIKQPIGSTAFVLIARGKSRHYLVLGLLQNVVTVAFMCIGVRWGPAGVAIADVAATYLMAVPRLYVTFKDSPIRIGWILTTVARPVAASAVMGLVLIFLRAFLPTFNAPLLLMAAGAVAGLAFLCTWMLLPGGGPELFALVAALRSALQRRMARSTVVDPIAAVSGSATP